MNPKNKIKAGSQPKRLLIELRRLRRIHDVTIYSYFQTQDHIEDKLAQRNIDGKTILTTHIGDEETIIARSPFELLSRLSDVYPQILRESIFVRAISQFEAFLVEVVWEVAERTVEPFKHQKNVEYPQAKLLSYKSVDELRRDIVQQECRQLTGQGINYAEKYFRTRFDIRFMNAPVDYAEIQEMHERRHLFVHRCGTVDQRYRNLFAPHLEVGHRIEISAEYLHNSIASLTSLAEFILATIDSKWPPSEAVKQQISQDLVDAWSDHISEMLSLSTEMEYESNVAFRQRSYLGYWFKVEFNNETQALSHISPDFPYKVEEELHYLSEILIASNQISSNKVEWIVGGPKSLTGPYIGYQKIMAERNRFIEFESQRLEL